MSYREAFDLIDAGEGRWDIQHRGTLRVAGEIGPVGGSFELLDWTGRPLGSYATIDDALRSLHDSTSGRRAA